MQTPTALRAALERAMEKAKWGKTKRMVHAALRRRIGLLRTPSGWSVAHGRK